MSENTERYEATNDETHYIITYIYIFFTIDPLNSNGCIVVNVVDTYINYIDGSFFCLTLISYVDHRLSIVKLDPLIL